MEPRRTARALDALPRATLAELAGDVTALDRLVFLDDRDGWFLIEAPGAASDIAVGRFEPRIGEILTGGRHIPIYCGGDRGKVLWGVRDGQIVSEWSYCNRRRMDLRGLREVAEPISLERFDLTQAEVEALRAEVAADPTRVPVTLPAVMSGLPYQRIVVFPWVWTERGTAAALSEAEALARAEIDTALSAHTGDYAVTPAPIHAVAATGTDPASGAQVPGLVLGRGEAPGIVPGLAAAMQPIFRIACTEAACLALDTLRRAPALDPWRDIARLDAALDAALPLGVELGAVAPPGRAELAEEAVSLSPIGAERHIVRIAVRRAGAGAR